MDDKGALLLFRAGMMNWLVANFHSIGRVQMFGWKVEQAVRWRAHRSGADYYSSIPMGPVDREDTRRTLQATVEAELGKT